MPGHRGARHFLFQSPIMNNYKNEYKRRPKGYSGTKGFKFKLGKDKRHFAIEHVCRTKGLSDRIEADPQKLIRSKSNHFRDTKIVFW